MKPTTINIFFFLNLETVVAIGLAFLLKLSFLFYFYIQLTQLRVCKQLNILDSVSMITELVFSRSICTDKSI